MTLSRAKLGVNMYSKWEKFWAMATIKKALGLLEYFSNSKPEIGLVEFRRFSNFNKGTVHRYLTNLRDQGFLEQNQKSAAAALACIAETKCLNVTENAAARGM